MRGNFFHLDAPLKDKWASVQQQSFVVEETFTLGNRGRGKVFCLQVSNTALKGRGVCIPSCPEARDDKPKRPYFSTFSKAPRPQVKAIHWISPHKQPSVIHPWLTHQVIRLKNCPWRPIWQGLRIASIDGRPLHNSVTLRPRANIFW